MDTLSNVEKTEDAACLQYAGFTPDVIPEAKSLLTGVSVEYVPHPDKRWYVLRASYGRVETASEILIGLGEFAYLPRHTTVKWINGKKKRVSEPIVPNLLFAYLTKEQADSYVKNTPSLSFLTYYYDHFTLKDGKNPPLTVPQKMMMNFIRLLNVESDHVKIVDLSNCHYKSGDTVEIMSGPFEGVKGKVARVAGQQRVVVELKGVCAIATAYIPTAFLRVVENHQSQ